MFNEILGLAWFPIFLLLWNNAILIPNYFAWYKKRIVLKLNRRSQIKNKTATIAKNLAYRNRKHEVKIKASMVLLSVIAYGPIAISSGSLLQATTVSQSHVNTTTKGLTSASDSLSTITYFSQTRSNVDALQSALKLYCSNIDSDGQTLHPYQLIMNAFDKFYYFPEGNGWV